MVLLGTRNKPHKKRGWLSADWWAASFMMCSTSWVAVGSFRNMFPSEIPFTFIPSNRFLMHKENRLEVQSDFLKLFKILLPSPRCHWMGEILTNVRVASDPKKQMMVRPRTNNSLRLPQMCGNSSRTPVITPSSPANWKAWKNHWKIEGSVPCLKVCLSA